MIIIITIITIIIIIIIIKPAVLTLFYTQYGDESHSHETIPKALTLTQLRLVAAYNPPLK